MRSHQEAEARIAGKEFEVGILGGAATGAGCALDAQLRGLRTVLPEGNDFGSGTSSTSTKLIHGGDRYLEQAVNEFDLGEYRVVRRALNERIRMLDRSGHHPFAEWQNAAGRKTDVTPAHGAFQR